MSQTSIPCVLMRGGTSRGPYLHLKDLPTDAAQRDAVLLRLMGSPDKRQIDGIGGATTVTSKVAIVSKSTHPDADIDYLFAQVDIEDAIVDWSPTCGNMLSGIAPFAIEEGLFPASVGETTLMIRNVNTESFISATVQTPNGELTYEGATAIDGVPGTGAPIRLNFFKITGSKTGKLLPTGNVRDTIDGVDVTCIDVAMPMVIAHAASVGKTGAETPAELMADKPFLARIEQIRRNAALKMGLGDVAGKVIPKFAIVSEPQADGHFSSRYFAAEGKCHQSYAVSGSICISACSALAGTTVADMLREDERYPNMVRIEHPSGAIDVGLHVNRDPENFEVISGGALRTARRIFAGDVYIPTHVWQK